MGHVGVGVGVGGSVPAAAAPWDHRMDARPERLRLSSDTAVGLWLSLGPSSPVARPQPLYPCRPLGKPEPGGHADKGGARAGRTVPEWGWRPWGIFWGSSPSLSAKEHSRC